MNIFMDYINILMRMGDFMKIDKALREETQDLLLSYKIKKIEIMNLELEIEDLIAEVDGVKAVQYRESTSKTYKFNSSVENEILERESEINKMLKEKRKKEILIEKVDNAMSSLNKDERDIIELRYFNKESWNTIGATINKDANYCGKLGRIAINKISKLIWLRKSCVSS